MEAHICFSISAQIWFGSMQALCTRPPLAENILHSKSNNLPILNRAKKLMVLTVYNASSIRSKPNFSFPCLHQFFLLICLWQGLMNPREAPNLLFMTGQSYTLILLPQPLHGVEHHAQLSFPFIYLLNFFFKKKAWCP